MFKGKVARILFTVWVFRVNLFLLSQKVLPLSVRNVYFLLLKCYPLFRVSFVYLNERMNACILQRPIP